MPGHISAGFSMQLFCPESVCVELSSQEAAWLGAAGLSCARAHLPGSVPSLWEYSIRNTNALAWLK